MTEPSIGDTNFLASYFINTRVYGVVIPGQTQSEFMATYEIQGDQGTMMIAVAIGPEGPPGADMFLLTLVNDGVETVGDLPQTLTPTTADIGKYWLLDDVDANGDIIGSSAYIWYGSTYRRLMFGTPGPPGPVPIITPTVELTGYPGTSQVITGGTEYEPLLGFQLAIPPGPDGPGAALAVAPDVDLTTVPPQPGDVLGCTGQYVIGYLAAPTELELAEYGSGGTWTVGTYYWIVTAVNAAGETTPSNEVYATVGATASVLLNWQAPPGQEQFGPTGYNIYRGTSSGGENTLVAAIASGDITTYTDHGSGTTSAGVPPNVNSAEVAYPVWAPVGVSQLIPTVYSMPEAAFTAYSGISQQAGIGSFVIPPQAFPWTPVVWGHIGAFGVELSSNPLEIGAQVLLGDPTSGTNIGRGFGNSLGEVNIMPHYSSPSNTGAAITPTNGIAVVPANHSNPAEGTIYVNLYNDGDIGLYTFSPTDAQIFVMLLPIYDAETAAAETAAAPIANALSGGGASLTFATPTGEGTFVYTAEQQAMLAPISGMTATGSSSGGSLSAGTYYWVVTSININGESLPSNEATATTTGSSSSVALAWTAVPLANGYNIYRGTTSGSENALVASVTTNSYTDTGTSGSVGTPPKIDSSAASLVPTSLASGSGAPGVASPPTFDAVGAGGTATSLFDSVSSVSWSHTLGTGANYIEVRVTMAWYQQGLTATVGGTAMKLAGYIGNDKSKIYSGQGGQVLFTLTNPPTGTQTVAVHLSPTVYIVAANSMSFSGVESVGNPVYNDGTGKTMSSGIITTVPGCTVVTDAFSCSVNSAITGYSGTQEWSHYGSEIYAISLAMGYESSGSSGQASITAANAGGQWASISLPLYGSPVTPATDNLTVLTVSSGTLKVGVGYSFVVTALSAGGDVLVSSPSNIITGKS